jgi:peptidoglycan hydrolase CwlO-like protein
LRKRRKRKGIESLKSQIREHQLKIAEEKSYPDPNLGLIKYWEREIRTFENEIRKIERQLTRGRR